MFISIHVLSYIEVHSQKKLREFVFVSGYLLCKCHPPPLIIPNPFLPPPNPHPCRPTALWAAGVEPYGPKVGKTQEDDHEEIIKEQMYGPMGAWANEMSIDDQEDSVEEHAKC